LEQLTNKGSIIDKKTVTNLVEIKKSSYVKNQTLEKGTNTNPIIIKNQEDSYIEVLSTNKLLEVSKAEGSSNKTQDTRMPYQHPNYKNHRIIQRTNQQ
jgi:hypothetical protein